MSIRREFLNDQFDAAVARRDRAGARAALDAMRSYGDGLHGYVAGLQAEDDQRQAAIDGPHPEVS
jgi:hypothetical protein